MAFESVEEIPREFQKVTECKHCRKRRLGFGRFPESGLYFCRECWPQMKQRRFEYDRLAVNWDRAIQRRLGHQ